MRWRLPLPRLLFGPLSLRAQWRLAHAAARAAARPGLTPEQRSQIGRAFSLAPLPFLAAEQLLRVPLAEALIRLLVEPAHQQGETAEYLARKLRTPRPEIRQALRTLANQGRVRMSFKREWSMPVSSDTRGSILYALSLTGCQSRHTGACRGTVEPCERCGLRRCSVEGSSSLSELCDGCWLAVAKGAPWPTKEAAEVQAEYQMAQAAKEKDPCTRP